MSNKRKRRCILSLPHSCKSTSEQEQKLALDKKSTEDFNTGRRPITPANNFSDDLDDILEFGIEVSGFSSNSSLSWSEEYESEIGIKVQSELEKIDRLFQGIKDEKSYVYDLEEIAEWKRFFPTLYILGYRTPTNSPEISDYSEDEYFVLSEDSQEKRTTIGSRKRSSVFDKRQQVSTHSTHSTSLPRNPQNLDIDQYLRISSLESPNHRKENQTLLNKQNSKEILENVTSTDFSSLPFIHATPMKSMTRKKPEVRRKTFLPPIESTLRSISASSRQASSRSMFTPNFERSARRQTEADKLKSDLLRLFDHILIGHR